MSRRPRLHMPGAFYHVTLRGNHRRRIFFRNADRDLLERYVAESLERYAARLHAYCWMSNHLHLLVQISETPLGRLMGRIATAYARTVQLRLNRTGHLFERRYHAVLVDSDSYLLTLLRYIHLNPVRAGIVNEPALFPWSSHHCYLGHQVKSWVTTDLSLRLFASRRGDAIRRYREFMSEPELDRWGTGKLTPNPDQPLVLGDDAFITKLVAAGVVKSPVLKLQELAERCCRLFQMTLGALTSPSRARRLAPARAWLAHEAVACGAATLTTVAKFLGRTEGALRHLMQRHPHATDNNE